MKIKVLVTMDGDGHFSATPSEEREKCIQIIKDIDYGDMWANEGENVLSDMEISEEDLPTLDDENWSMFIRCFSGGGRMEEVSLDIGMYNPFNEL